MWACNHLTKPFEPNIERPLLLSKLEYCSFTWRIAQDTSTLLNLTCMMHDIDLSLSPKYFQLKQLVGANSMGHPKLELRLLQSIGALVQACIAR